MADISFSWPTTRRTSPVLLAVGHRSIHAPQTCCYHLPHPQFSSSVLQDEEPRSPARAALSSPKLQRNSSPNASLRAPQDLSEPNDAHLTPHILPGTPSQAPPHSQSRPARGTSPVLESKAGDANFSADRLSAETGWHLSLCEAHAQEAALWAVMTSGGERRQDP